MTGLYQLQDIIWDELGEGDDHLVPCPGNRHGDEIPSENQRRKRTHAAICGPRTSNADAVAPSNIYWNNEDGNHISLRENEQMENGLWTNSFDGVSRDGDSNNGVFKAGSDGITDSLMKSVTDNLHGDDPILRDRGTVMVDNLYQYPLSHATAGDNDLNVFNSNLRDKENNNLSFYDWPDIQNFEDVDRMFRSCDSTFGLETNSENGLGWFSSVQATDVSDDAFRSNSMYPISEAEIASGETVCNEASCESKSSLLVRGSNMKPGGRKARSKKSIADGSAISMPSSLATVTDSISQVNKEKQSYAVSEVEKKGPFHQIGASQPDSTYLMAEMACSEFVSCQKREPFGVNRTKAYGEVNGYTTGIQAELDSSNAQESCSISSDEHSLEAISFRQLHHVLEKLDSRTKLCIRDSLYRLARSAEHRDTCGNSTYGSHVHRSDASLLTSDGTNKSTGLMDMETDTNPIDRSIAHLLFHRPSAPSVVPALGLSPRFKVLAPSNDHPQIVEELGGAAESRHRPT